MKDDFIRNQRTDRTPRKEETAYNSIIRDLMVNNKRGDDKCNDLDDFDSESSMPGVLIPGSIYIFTYKADKPTVYPVPGEKPIEFYDSVPVVLILRTTNNSVQGINLNLCNSGLRTLILNIFYNLDPDFFELEAYKMAARKQPTLSKKILSFLQKGDAVDILNAYLKKMYNINSYAVIFRTYNIQNIKRLRMIEPWQWKMLPNLNYNGTVKKDVLDKIHKITGISTIKV